MSPRMEIGRLSRLVAGMIGLIWMAAGIAAIVLGARATRWSAVVLGVLALYFGAIWWRVARTGRYVLWPFSRRTTSRL
jgi:hypothetical protein